MDHEAWPASRNSYRKSVGSCVVNLKLFDELLAFAAERFAKVDAQFSNAEDTQVLRLGAIEDRMLSFQRQVEERSRTDLNMAVCIIDFLSC